MSVELSIIQHILQTLRTSNVKILDITPEDPWLELCDEITGHQPYKLDDQHIQSLIEVISKLPPNTDGRIFQVEYRKKIDTQKSVSSDRSAYTISIEALKSNAIAVYSGSIDLLTRGYYRTLTDIETIEWTDPDLLEKIEQAITSTNEAT